MAHGAVAGFPVKGVRVTLVDGSYHTVDSSEMAFKMAGSIAMSEALEQRRPGAARADHARDAVASPRTPSATSSATSTRAAGARRAWSRRRGMTEVKAEVPMAEMLTYAPDLRSITGGQGDYTMEFVRYEEVPAHLAQQVVEQARRGGGGPPAWTAERRAAGCAALLASTVA